MSQEPTSEELEKDLMTQEQTEEELENINFQIGYQETGLNGGVISWKYWVKQMPALSAAQAARLMSALDPDLYVDLNNRHGNIDSTEATSKAAKTQQLAEARGLLTASPAEWLTWAQSLGISVHDGFRLEVLELPESRNQSQEKKKKGLDSSSNDWKTNAREIAISILKNKPKLSVEQIAEKTYEEMLTKKKNGLEGMTGRGGKTPSADTIKRHALTGIKS